VLVPPTTGEGATLTKETEGGITVTTVFRVELPSVAVKVALVTVLTGVVVRETVALLAPCARFTEAGTVTPGVLLER
jgi:hypothetical protein